jgi:hypothetical protein
LLLWQLASLHLFLQSFLASHFATQKYEAIQTMVRDKLNRIKVIVSAFIHYIQKCLASHFATQKKEAFQTKVTDQTNKNKAIVIAFISSKISCKSLCNPKYKAFQTKVTDYILKVQGNLTRPGNYFYSNKFSIRCHKVKCGFDKIGSEKFPALINK